MFFRRFIFVLMVFICTVYGLSVQAMTFADYAYRQARAGRISSLYHYVAKGYNVDAVDENGFSALCMAVRDKDYATYKRLRQLGAKINQDCMNRVNERVADAYNSQEILSSSSLKNSAITDNTALYVGGGLLAAGGVAAVALAGSGSSSHHSQSGCPEGKELVDGKCQDIVCPEGQELVGGKCQDIVCPEGQELVDGKCQDICPAGQIFIYGECQDIVCPEGKVLINGQCEDIVCPKGKELVDGKCQDIVCPAGTVLQGNVCVISHECGENERWDGEKCAVINCPAGTHLVGKECVADDTCLEGQRLVKAEGSDEYVCEAIVCEEGTHLSGSVCVADTRDDGCPQGQYKNDDGVCVSIECPEGTSLVGNLCMADASASKVNVGDNSFYGVVSENKSVFNLYSSPAYPNDENSIILHNTGNGNVYGMYGYRGEVFNSYVVGASGEIQNKKPVGTGTIKITDNGSGTVYGMYSHISDITEYKEAINASGWNNGTAYGNIDITHTGGGTTYGLFGDVRAYNTFAIYGGSAYGDITVHGDGDIYGLYGYVAVTNGLSPFFGGNYAKGDINLYSTGNGNVYGVAISKDDIPGAGGTGQSWFAFNSYGGAGNIEGHINIHNTGNGNVYGMYGGQQLYNATSTNDNISSLGTIDITNLGNGNIYGMYLPDADTVGRIENVSDEKTQSIINLVNTGSGVSTGMRGGEGSSILNSGTININNVGNGTAVGIYAEKDSYVANKGMINIYRNSFTDALDGAVYTPIGAKGGTAYGIYAETGATVINSGTITVTGAENGAGIYVENGATLENSGTVIFNGAEGSVQTDGSIVDIYGDRASRGTASVNLNNLGGGEIVLAQGGQFFARQLSGDMAVASSVAQGSFDDVYTVANALQTRDANELNLSSKSVMFTALKKQNEDSSYDVVLERKSFDSLLNNQSAAQFWEKNYEQANGLELFDYLKSAESITTLQQMDANIRSEDIIPSFNRENAFVYRHLAQQFNDSLFNRPNENYMGGYKYLDISRDKDGTLQGNDGTANVAYGMLKGTSNEGITYGVGATIAQLKSEYDNGSERKSNIFGLWAPVGYNFKNGSKWFSKFYAGYEDGSYDRVTNFGKYSSDVKSYQYGLSNEVRHSLLLNHGFQFTPTAELNLLGIYQEGFDEGEQDKSVHTDSHNALSLEGGIGAYLSKEMLFDENNKLGIRIGGIYYVEFLNPDEGIDARIKGVSGKYKISHHFNDTRAALSARIDYNYRNFTLYGMIEKELGDYEALTVDIGLQYNM